MSAAFCDTCTCTFNPDAVLASDESGVTETDGGNAKCAQPLIPGATELAVASRAAKDAALEAMAQALLDHTDQVLAANAEDVAAAEVAGTPGHMIDRLRLDAARVAAMAQGLRDVAGLPDPVSAEVTMVPQNVVKLVGKDAEGAVKLVNALEDNDDVQNVYSNMDVDDSVLESLG